MALRSQICDKNSWDLSKENIQPLKSGRSVSNVESTSINENSLKQQRLNFEEEIRLNNGDDPLEVWYRYIKWTEQNYPSGKDNQLRNLVQKCLNVLKDQKQYANDIRWWYVWQKFASLSYRVGSLGIYEFMNSDGICTRLAAFYKQWAFELERGEDYAKATDVYKKGLLAEAQPLQDLENAFHEYQSRVSRVVSSQGDESCLADETTRNFLGVLKGVGKRATAPIVRQSSLQEVKVSKRTAESFVLASTTNSAFTIFDQNQAVQAVNPLIAQQEINMSSFGNDCTKENFRKPDIWTKQKVKHGSFAQPKENGSDFKVYVDNSTAEEFKKPIVTGSVLKPVENPDSAKSSLPNCMSSEKKPSSKQFKEVLAYNEKIVNGGVIEMSFEEARALLYASTKPSKSLNKANNYKEESVVSNGYVTSASNHSLFCPTNEISQPTNIESQCFNRDRAKQATTVLSNGSLTDRLNSSRKAPVLVTNCQENDKENRFNGESSLREQFQAKDQKQIPPYSAVITANTSFTCNVYRDAMAVFSNTLPLNGFEVENGSSNLVENSFNIQAKKSETSVERPLNNNQASVLTGAASFNVYDENTEKKSPTSLAVFSNDDNKENVKPFDMLAHVPPLKRQTSGILTLATNVPFEPEPEDERPVVPTNEIRRSSLLAGISDVVGNSNLSGLFTHFQLDDPTIAGLMKTLLADRAASTPCHNGSRVAVPSFSSGKPWQLPLNLDNQSSFEAEDCSKQNPNAKSVEGSGNKMIPVAETKVNMDGQAPSSTYNYGTKLSTINETSREYRSSSCSSSSTSGSTSSDAFGSRKRLLSGCSTNSTNLQPIYEQLTFANTTPSSQAASFGRTPREDLPFHSDERRTDAAVAVTPYDNCQPFAKDVGDTKAVRKLYSNDENVDENVEFTGFGTKISITSRLNPWDPEVVGQLLCRIPKRLDQFTNYHHFAFKLPSIRVGKTIDLSGEVYAIERLIGEGAFAKVYKCHLAENLPDSPSSVLKVQKPSCPWEFYVCEELRRRLTSQNLMPFVGRSIMRVQDGYIFCDGSVLLYDYCSYGTLLDVINVYKKSSTCLSEYFAMYLTVEMLRLLEAIHSCGFIHADVKPDNFLFCALDFKQNDEILALLSANKNFCIRLIDWGRAIDMNLLPSGTTFSGKVNTSGFQCCEMQDGRNWTFQTDYFGLLATVHVLLFGDYMRVYKCSSSGRWKMTSSFKRRWKAVDVWRKFFDELLNVGDCNSLPNLASYRIQFENSCVELIGDDISSLANELTSLKQMWTPMN